MKDLELDNMKKKIGRQKVRLRERYNLAKSLGLDCYEAGHAQQWSEKRIRDYSSKKRINEK